MSIRAISRRQALKSVGAGFGYVALAGMLGQETRRAAAAPKPLAPKESHFKPKAKRIIFLFMQGSMSQVDTVEYKPQLQKDGGKPGPGGGTLTASKFKFQQYGKTGSWFSELLPNLGQHADKMWAAGGGRAAAGAVDRPAGAQDRHPLRRGQDRPGERRAYYASRKAP